MNVCWRSSSVLAVQTHMYRLSLSASLDLRVNEPVISTEVPDIA
jgi:hypothetical protein